MLGHPILPSLQDSRIRLKASLSQRRHQGDEDLSVRPPRHVRHILDEYRTGLQRIYPPEEGAPQAYAVIFGGSAPAVDQTAQLGCARPREWLARRTSSHQVNSLYASLAE